MPFYHAKILESAAEICESKRVLFQEYCRELGPGVRTSAPAGRLTNSFDAVDSTLFLGVYADEKIVGGARILRESAEIALTCGTFRGLELELKLNLSSAMEPDDVLIEVTQLHVAEEHQRSDAKYALYKGIYEVGRMCGATGLLGGANCRTDARIDAMLMFQQVELAGKVSRERRAEPWTTKGGPEVPIRPFYTPDQRLRALRGRWHGVELPHTLRSFMFDMGAVSLGAPVYDDVYNVFSLPMLASMSDIPERTLARFRALDRGNGRDETAALTESHNKAA